MVSHNWGWFSCEDPRMHLQTVDEGARGGRVKIKVWLEDRGKRVFERAEGTLSAPDQKKLEAKIDTERKNIESRWIDFMIVNRWFQLELRGSLVILTAYPGHNSFKREIDLRNEFPGAYEMAHGWDETPPKLSLDHEHSALAVGSEDDPDDREHIDLVKWVFQD